MGQKSFIFLAVAMTVLIAGAVAVYLYDTSNENRIAEGVSVAGVDVGGLEAEEARRKVQRAIAEPVAQPVVVTHGKRSFRLSAEDARVRVDVGGMVDQALRASRQGNVLSRALRDLTGGEEDATVAGRVSYSKRAAARLVKRVEESVAHPAKDATLNFPSLTQVREQPGVAVQTGRLRKRVASALTSAYDRRVAVPTKRVKPEVTRAELADKYPTLIVVDRGAFKLRFYRRLKLAKEYTVAIGAIGRETPAGLYNIQNKAVNPAWNVPNSDWAGDLAGTVVPAGSPENPLKARWMGIYDGAGIHGTDVTSSLGTAASKGCVRMAIPDVIELYDQVDVGAPIYIA